MDQLDKKLNVTTKRYVCINCMVYIRFRNYEVATLYPGFLLVCFLTFTSRVQLCVSHMHVENTGQLEGVSSLPYPRRGHRDPLTGRGEDEGK